MLADEPDGSHGADVLPRSAGLISCRPMAPSSTGAAWRRSCATQLTFHGNAFMLFVLAFDPIFVLAAIMRQPFGDLVWSACCAALVFSIRVELHELPDGELVHGLLRFVPHRPKESPDVKATRIRSEQSSIALQASTRLTPLPDRRTISADHRPDVFGDQLQLCSLPARIVPLCSRASFHRTYSAVMPFSSFETFLIASHQARSLFAVSRCTCA
jgi:hypothetical protein